MSGPGAAPPSAAGAVSAAPGVPAVPSLPADGILEELDGRPIGPSSTASPPAAPALPWRRGAVAATAMTIRRPGLWVFALVAFLARGGLAILLLPIVVVPTFIGLANFVGPASVTAGGAGPRLVALVVAGLTAGLALAVLGTLLAAAAELALHRATAATPEARSLVPAEPAAAEAGPARRAVARVAVIRLVLLVPVAIVVSLAIPTWVAVAYRELTLPSDVAAPLVVRVLAGAPAASVAVLVAWLAAEVVGGFAARRAALFGAPAWRALAGGLLDPLRAPAGTILTVAAALGLTVVLLAPAVWALGAAWGAARHALAGGSDPLLALGAALLLAAAWLGVLVLAAFAASWRATLATTELLRRHH